MVLTEIFWLVNTSSISAALRVGNCGTLLSIDETCLSHDELYTIVTNKAFRGKKGVVSRVQYR